MVSNAPASAADPRDEGSIPGSGRSPGGEHGNPLQYSCLENPVDRGAWRLQSTGSQESNTTEAIERTHILGTHIKEGHGSSKASFSNS